MGGGGEGGLVSEVMWGIVDKGNYFDAVFMGISKTFDTINQSTGG